MSPSRIVITGTIGSGKSTVIDILKEYGFNVLSADEINRFLLEKNQANYLAIKNSREFESVFEGDILDKKRLAEIIFSDESKLKKLNSLTHGNIFIEMDKRIKDIESKVVFLEIPLFFQMDIEYKVDEVWLVVADYGTQVERLMKREGIGIDYAKSKIETQENLLQMEEASDIIIDNSKSIDDLRKNIKSILESKELL